MPYAAAARGWLGPVKDRTLGRPVRIPKATDMANVGYLKAALDYVDSLPRCLSAIECGQSRQRFRQRGHVSDLEVAPHDGAPLGSVCAGPDWLSD
jgi:hypothetical protein